MKNVLRLIPLWLLLLHVTSISFLHSADGGPVRQLIVEVSGDKEVVEALVAAGISVNLCNEDGVTPLMVAASVGNNALVDSLIEARATVDQVDKEGRSALFYAIDGRNIVAVQKLASCGANLSRLSTRGITPLIQASVAGFLPTVWYLLDKGVDPNEGEVFTALDEAIVAQQQSIVDYLITYGADVNRKREHGLTPLMLAASHNHSEIVAQLIHRKADVMATDTLGLSAISYAQARGNNAIAQLILSHMPEQVCDSAELECDHD